MKLLLIVLLAVSSFSYADEKKQDDEPKMEVSVKSLVMLMKLAEDQKQIIEDLQDKLYDVKKEVSDLEDKCTF